MKHSPIKRAPKLGVQASGEERTPSVTSRLDRPADRDSRIDQAKPMITSDSDRIDRMQTSHATCARRGVRLRHQVKGTAAMTQITAASPQIISEKPSTRVNSGVQNRA